MAFILDPVLEQYATVGQWKYLKDWEKHGSIRAAAKASGATGNSYHQAKKAVLRKAALQGYSPEHDMVRPVPDGLKLKGVSTYYGADGEVRGQWVKSQADRERQAELLREMIAGFAAKLPREEPVPAPTHTMSKLMACYPVGDHHTGMLAWGEETGGSDYDISIAQKLLKKAINSLVYVAPPTSLATVVFLGDFMHYDSFETVTPSSRNALDADSRFPKMVRGAIRSMRHLIMKTLDKHKHVHVIVEVGNHDLSCSIFLMECLSNIYENEPRVSVDTSPSHYHYFSFGKCLVGVHHGHGAKMPQLPMIMAADRAEDWGKSKFRYWWTGHVHHDQMKDFHGTKVESFRILAPSDAWAAQKGYRAAQDMKCIVLHSEYGEVARHTVNPEMLK